jgi:sugar lactone lactonase YvrE
LNDILYLPLKAGSNELLLIMGEGFGGWGFMFQGSDVLVDERLEKAWETEAVFSVSESVLYDAERDVLYVTNFDQFRRTTTGRVQYISKLSTEGEVLELKYIDSLDNPLGMCIHKDYLYVAEKGGYAIVDLSTAKVVEHIALPDALFPNDIEVDDSERVYISDSRKNIVWRVDGTTIESWLEGSEILDPNTIKIIDGRLYVGNSGDQRLKAFDLETKEMEIIADFVPGFIDGIRQLPSGELLVSLWDGKLYRISGNGDVDQLLDLKNEGVYIADFEYLPESGMLYIPTFYQNTVLSYKINW